MAADFAERLIAARRGLKCESGSDWRPAEAAEGGCGVLGLASNILIAGRHILTASQQMHNRGNGKGGGIAMAGLDPQQMRVSPEILRSHYLVQIALLDPGVQPEVEAQFIHPYFDVATAYALDHLDDYRAVDGLEIRPPDVWRYFLRVKPDVLDQFAQERGLAGLPRRSLEDEFVYQNSFRLNQQFYASLGEKRAFVLCHGRDLIVLKIVGYAEQVASYYRLEGQSAHVWIAHQRYPTKGRVWHPGGAHPFIGLNEALVHNGDFANYHAVSEYLKQRNIYPLFLTDTEVGAQLFDLLDRVYGYPLEVTLEAMAPTTEHDFSMLPPQRQALYEAAQTTHIHGSPDGPWFFIVARSKADEGRAELIGITDTSMLRPQVFALYENVDDPQGSVQIGVIASERQAINACLRSISEEDTRFQPLADRYWVARGGSHTDGGAFLFSYAPESGLMCTNKFGEAVALPGGRAHHHRKIADRTPDAHLLGDWQQEALHAFDNGGVPSLWGWLKPGLPRMDWATLAEGLKWMRQFASEGDPEWNFVLGVHNLLRDRVTDVGDKKRSSFLALVDGSLGEVLAEPPILGEDAVSSLGRSRRLTWGTRRPLSPPPCDDALLIVDASGFPAEGEQAAARWMVEAYHRGWKHLIACNWRGGRFAAAGLGPATHGLRIDLYGDIGDYAASGLDGAEVHLHGDGQDQLAQIMRAGRLVIYGDVGQTFLYGAKGGEVFVRGSTAGRPLINAVGRPRVVINGTCLDYLAESFMAGDPLTGGGFVILNGIALDEAGRCAELPSPYPGGNLFSLASGGAIYVRDPHRLVDDDQLNGGCFTALTGDDWALIRPYLEQNERLFGISLADLLTVDGQTKPPEEVYRKVTVHTSGLLREMENR